MLGVSNQRRLCDDFAMTSTVCITSVWPEEHWNFKIWTTDIDRLNTVMCMWNHSILVYCSSMMSHVSLAELIYSIFFTTWHNTVLNSSLSPAHTTERARFPCVRGVGVYRRSLLLQCARLNVLSLHPYCCRSSKTLVHREQISNPAEKCNSSGNGRTE